MPKAPELQQQVQTAGLPGVRLGGAPTAESYGAGLGETTRRIGLALYEQEIRSADQAAVMEAETRAGQEQLRIMQGVTQLRGKNAAEAPLFAAQEFDKINADIEKGLNGDRQKGMYQSVVRHKKEALDRFALSHFNQENDRFQEDTFKANISQSVDVARANAENPMQVALEKALQEQKIRARATRLGFDGTPQEREEINTVHSRTNTEVINALLTKGQDLRAKAYYDQLKKGESGDRLEFTAQDRGTVEKALLEGSTRGEAHRQTIKLLGEVGMDTPEQRRQALNMADAMDNEKVGELVRQKLEHRFSQEDKRKQEGYQQTFGNATKLIDEQWKQVPTATAREMVPANVWADLGIQDRHTLDTYVAQLRDPGKKATDLPTWVTLNAMKDEDLAKVSRSNMLGYLTKLDNSDGDKLLTRWNGVINAKDSKQKDVKYEEFLTNKQLLDNAMELTGYFDLAKPRSKWPLEHQQLENRVQKLVDQALSQIPKDAPREKKEKAIQDIVDAQVKANVKVDKGIFSFEKERAVGEFEDFKDAASIRVPLKEIPAADQDMIKGLLREGNKKLDNGKIERIYALKRLQRAGKIDRQALIDQTKKIVEE